MFITYYHNVVEGPLDDLDRRSSRLSVQAFRKQMTFLSEHFRPVSLEELLDRADRGRTDPACVAVTFDDAYEGVGTHAAPVLKEFNIPATVFVISQTLKVPERPLHFEDFELALRRTVVERIHLPELDLKPIKLTSIRGKALFLKRVKPLLKDVTDERRQRLHKIILERLGVDATQLEVSVDIRKLSPHQLKEMNRSPWWEVGGHTRTHRVLSQLSAQEAQREIEGCFDDLVATIKVPPRYFAYPYGKPKHIGKTHEIVRSSGFQAAFTTSQGSVTREVDPYRIPRVDFLDLMACQEPDLQKKAREYFFS